MTARSPAAEIAPPPLPAGLDTPCLVVDLDVVEANARRMAEAMASRDVALRPHVKTHKSAHLARLQLEAGARGLTVGTLGEAEVMAAAGLTDLLLAYPIFADGPKAARLRALLDGLPLAVGIDSVPGAERLAAAAAGTIHPLHVLVEVDPGNGRTGVHPDRVVDLALAARALGLAVDGVFAHGGHAYRGPDAVAGAAMDEVASLGSAAENLRSAGFECPVVSAGSTPTALLAAAGPITEIRAGTYLLGDRIQAALGAAPPDGLALWVAATVVSTAVPGQVVVDAGAKTLTKDKPDYLEGHGLLPAYPGAVIERVNDYHGIVRLAAGDPGPRLGEVVAILPNHACPVVDLVDSFVVARGGMALDRWPVDARGRSG
jgi:D-serine deaminase-like pyridoxal phosphate-dependent protein